jgi:ADYC domain
MPFPFLLSFIGAILLLGHPGPVQALGGRLEVDRGEFRLRLDDGRVLEQEELVGIRILMQSSGQDVQVRIESVEQDSTVRDRPVLLYRLLVEDPLRGTAQDACLPDIRGRQLGLPIQKETGVDFTCTSGAEGKCILMGYRPWEEGSDVPMRDLHAACIHMMRADYGGDDHPTTRDGTSIIVYDRFGIQQDEPDDPMPFEAAWGKSGALCIAHPRIARNVSLEALEQRYPRLVGSLGPGLCTEDAMRERPDALLFNRSALTPP